MMKGIKASIMMTFSTLYYLRDCSQIMLAIFWGVWTPPLSVIVSNLAFPPPPSVSYVNILLPTIKPVLAILKALCGIHVVNNYHLSVKTKQKGALFVIHSDSDRNITLGKCNLPPLSVFFSNCLTTRPLTAKPSVEN